jgi:hypothetical protein
MACSKFADASVLSCNDSSSFNVSSKDLNFNLGIEDLAKVQRLDENRATKMSTNEHFQQVGRLNHMRVWKRSMVEYTDKRYPGDVMQYVDTIPVKGLPDGKPKKIQAQHIRPKDPEERATTSGEHQVL